LGGDHVLVLFASDVRSTRHRTRCPVASRLRQEATWVISSAIRVPDRWRPHGNVIYVARGGCFRDAAPHMQVWPGRLTWAGFATNVITAARTARV
jgi:hypothetical protein